MSGEELKPELTRLNDFIENSTLAVEVAIFKIKSVFVSSYENGIRKKILI